jgi:hypothetical protein
MMNSKKYPRATYDVLQGLMSMDGELSIRIHILKNNYVPFVFFTQPGQTAQGYGPIVHDNCMVASASLDDLIAGLRESLGGSVPIYAPHQPIAKAALH